MDPRPPYELNDPDYHPWLMADGGRAFFNFRETPCQLAMTPFSQLTHKLDVHPRAGPGKADAKAKQNQAEPMQSQ